MVRMTEGAIAAIAGGADALITAKVSGTAPGKVPWPVVYEVGLIAVGFFGDKVGVSKEHSDAAAMAGLTLAGARATRLALAGKLMSGPQSWGGAGGDPTYALSAGATGGDADPALGGAGAKSVRLLAGRKAAPGVGGASIYPAMAEAPGVAG